jgi:hypothetical protein
MFPQLPLKKIRRMKEREKMNMLRGRFFLGERAIFGEGKSQFATQ